jgi:ectoine hydroxylase-related dioxygenase (phytanoyl-CoA dioxygenase family)
LTPALPPGARLHPWNRGFTWSAPGGAPRRLSSTQLRDWSERGCFVLEDAFDADTVREVIAEIDPWEAKASEVLRGRPGGKLFIAEEGNITFTVHLVLRSPRLAAFCRHAVFQDLAHDLLGPDVRLYWDQAVYKKPERPGTFPWHQDNGYTYLEPQQYLTCWVALTDATRENGCPWVVPGLHRLGTLEHWMTDAGWQCLREPQGTVPVEARAGSVVVFSSLTPHATGPNTTDAVRKAYIVQLAPDGARALRDGARTAQDDPQRQFLVLRGGRAA